MPSVFQASKQYPPEAVVLVTVTATLRLVTLSRIVTVALPAATPWIVAVPDEYVTVAIAVFDELTATVPFAFVTVTTALLPAATCTEVGETVRLDGDVTVTATLRLVTLSRMVTVALPAATP